MAGAPFECPFDRLTVLSNVEGLTALREIEGVARPTEKRKRAGINPGSGFPPVEDAACGARE